MWSRKPTPVSRVPSPLPSSARVRRTSVSPVLRSIVAVRAGVGHTCSFMSWMLGLEPCCGHETDSPQVTHRPRRHGQGSLRGPPSTPRAPRTPPRARSARPPRPACAPFPAHADPHLLHPPAEVPRRQPRGKARRAAGRQHVVGARHVVAERGRARRADEQRSRPSARSARAPRRRRRSAPGARARARSRAPPPRARPPPRTSAHAASPTVGTCRRRIRSSASPARRASRARRRDRHDEAARAVLGLREHVERGQLHLARAGVRAEHDHEVARPREPVDPDRRRQLALGLLHVQVARADDHVDAAAPSRCRTPARRSPARRRSGTRAPPRTAGSAEDRRVDLPVRARRRAHDDVQHARRARRHDAHHDRARIRRAPARHIHGGRLHRHLAQRITSGPAAARPSTSSLTPAWATARDVRDRHLQPGHELQRQPLDRRVELLLR